MATTVSLDGANLTIPTANDTSWDRNLNASLVSVAARLDQTPKVFSVLKYGAKGDGTTDDTSAIQAAITAAGAAGGGVVSFPATSSYYRLTAQIEVVSDYVMLVGQGRGTQLRWDSAFSGNCISIRHDTVGTHRRHVSVENFQVRGGSATCKYIYVLRGNEIKINHIWALGAGTSSEQVAIYLDWGTNAASDYGTATHIDNLTTGSIKYGIRVNPTNADRYTGISITRCFLTGPTSGGGTPIAGSIAVDNLDGGSFLAWNSIDTWDYAFKFGPRGAVKCFGNRIEGIATAGYTLQDASNCDIGIFDWQDPNDNCVVITANNGSIRRVTSLGSATSGQSNYIPGTIVHHGSGNTSPKHEYYNVAQTANAYKKLYFDIASSHTNPFGETVSIAEITDANLFTTKVGTTADLPYSIYINNTERAKFDASGITVTGRVVPRYRTPAYSASITIDAREGEHYEINANNGSAFTINAPTNPATGQRLSIIIKNTSGGALGAVTWNAVFKMPAWTAPADGFQRATDFVYNGTNWIQKGTPLDAPN